VRDPDELDALARLQADVADLLLAPDPVAALRERLARGDAAPALRAIDADGLQLAALLVAKLRFQMLTNGSRTAAEWFARDAAGFTAAWKRYHHSVPPRALDPWREADAFAAWCTQHDVSGRADPR
jgi:hypothetical protein